MIIPGMKRKEAKISIDTNIIGICTVGNEFKDTREQDLEAARWSLGPE